MSQKEETPKNKWADFDENAEKDQPAEAAQVEGQVDDEELLTDDHEVELTPEQQKYNELEERFTKAQDEAIRLRAEMENIRRRSQTEVADAHRFGAQKFAENMLSVLDGFDGALQGAKPSDGEAKQLFEGLEMTYDMFVKALEKSGVKAISPAAGEPFNPQYHEAMSMMQDPNATPNSVLQVLRKGYEINGRVIRAAMVIVNQG